MKKGIYKTRSGRLAIVVQIRGDGMNFFARGAIECPNTGVLVLHSWSINGLSDSKVIDLDLILSSIEE